MNKKLKKERRTNPRLSHTLPLKVAANGYDFSTATQNISCVGAYCRIDKYVPPFTKVMIKLQLPVNPPESLKKASEVECKGVIVRSEDEAGGGFNIAIFFNAIGNQERKTISRYINQFLPEASRAASS